MTEDRWMLDKIFQLEREAGQSEARHDASEAAISRVAQEVKDDIAEMKLGVQGQIGGLRAELLTRLDANDAQRKTDLSILTDAIEEVRQERANFGKALGRVAWAIVAAVFAAAATQYAALSPQVGAIVQRAAEQLP